jgi:cell wall assembly regulator SMI1
MEAEVIKQSDLIINELLKFSKTLLEIKAPIKKEEFEKFEHKISYRLPLDFKHFLMQFNGFSLNGTDVLGISENLKGESLESVYNFEHNVAENKMPPYLLPFSNDGRGNYYCIDLSRKYNKIQCPIVFWQWDFQYENINDIETCNLNFNDWVNEVMIEWTLEYYDYNGNER